jgi:hypothetical protein
MERLGCNPPEGMARIANGNHPCCVCLGKKKLKYSRDKDKGLVFDPEGKLMDCLHCFGSGKEPISIECRLRAFSDLQQYLFPKRKAVEVSLPPPGSGSFTLEELLTSYRKFDTGERS